MNKLENLLIVLAADDGKLKVFLEKKEEEPYKGYWTIPSEEIDSVTTVEQSSDRLFNEVTLLKDKNILQCGIFSDLDRKVGERVIGIASCAITDRSLIDQSKYDNMEWFDTNNLPKLAYDHKDIIEKVSEEIKNRIIYNYCDILLELFQDEFTLSELQKFYENILGKTIDRRNFRKKILNQNLVIDTGHKKASGSGRPGTLYYFNKENMKGKII